MTMLMNVQMPVRGARGIVFLGGALLSLFLWAHGARGADSAKDSASSYDSSVLSRRTTVRRSLPSHQDFHGDPLLWTEEEKKGKAKTRINTIEAYAKKNKREGISLFTSLCLRLKAISLQDKQDLEGLSEAESLSHIAKLDRFLNETECYFPQELLLVWCDVFAAFRSRYKGYEGQDPEKCSNASDEKEPLEAYDPSSLPQRKEGVSDFVLEGMEAVGNSLTTLKKDLLPIISQHLNAAKEAEQRLKTIQEKYTEHQEALTKFSEERDPIKKEKQIVKMEECTLEVLGIIKALAQDSLPKKTEQG